MKRIEQIAEELIGTDDFEVGLRSELKVAAIRGYRAALYWVLNNACGTTWNDDWAEMIRAIEKDLEKREEGNGD